MRPDFPPILDSTIIGAFRSCPQKANLAYIEHWKPRATSIHLHAGACYARGLEVTRRAFFEDGLPSEDSIALGMQALITAWGDYEAPEGSTKTLERTAGAFEYYFSVYPLETDKATPYLLPSGKRAIEFSFAEPLSINNPQTGEPLLYCGRTDQIVDFASGVYLHDDKTTSQLGASWSKQWDLRSQFTGYCWAAAKADIPVNGVLIRGVSILKTKYDTAQAITYRSQLGDRKMVQPANPRHPPPDRVLGDRLFRLQSRSCLYRVWRVRLPPDLQKPCS